MMTVCGRTPVFGARICATDRSQLAAFQKPRLLHSGIGKLFHNWRQKLRRPKVGRCRNDLARHGDDSRIGSRQCRQPQPTTPSATGAVPDSATSTAALPTSPSMIEQLKERNHFLAWILKPHAVQRAEEILDLYDRRQKSTNPPTRRHRLSRCPRNARLAANNQHPPNAANSPRLLCHHQLYGCPNRPCLPAVGLEGYHRLCLRPRLSPWRTRSGPRPPASSGTPACP